MLLGLVVIVGWYINEPALVQVLPQFVPMQYNTALGFLLSGIGLCALAWNKLKLSLACGVMVCLIGALTLIEYIFGVDLGIDQLFMEHYITVKTSHPGRMAHNTALCFSLVGAVFIINFLMIESRNKNQILRLLGALILVLGTVALVGYVSAVETAYGWANLTRMAVHTSAGFIVLSIGIMGYAWFSKNTDWKKMPVRWLSAVAAMMIVMFSISMWQEVTKQEARLIRRTLEEQAQLIEGHINKSVSSRVMALERMAHRWEVRKGTPQKEWRQDAYYYVKNQPGLKVVEWVDDTFHIRWIEPLEGNESTQNLDLTFEKKREMALKESRDSHKVMIMPPVDLVQGGKGIIAFFPIYIDDRFDGFIRGIFDIEDLLADIIPRTFAADYGVAVDINGDNVFTHGQVSKNYTEQWGYKSDIDIYETKWHIAVWPKRELLTRDRSILPEMLLIGGIIFALLFALTVNYGQTSRLLARRFKESENKLSAILKTAPDGIFTVNEKGIIQSVNQAITQIFGYRDEELIGKNIEILVPKERHKQHVKDVAGYVKKGSTRTMASGREVVGICKDGRKVPLEIGLSSTTLADGSTQVVATARDITERKKAQKEIEQAIEKLEASNMELERFAYVASHDLQEPLRMVGNFTKLLEKEYSKDLDEQALEYINFLADAASRMQELVNDLLEYSRVGQEAERLVDVDCVRALDNARVNLAESIKLNNAKLTNDVLPTIRGNPVRITRLLQNLIGNAIKYCDADKAPNVHISAEEKKSEWIFSIKDNGIGMKEEYLQKIFLPFKRLHSHDEYAGTGIGLAVCKKIVENFGGRIWAESKLGEGSVFYFTIPKNISKET